MLQFFYIYICSFITFLSYYSKIAFLDCLHNLGTRQFLMTRRIHTCIIIMMGRGVVLS